SPVFHRSFAVFAVVAAFAALPVAASASQTVDRNAKGARLAVNHSGVALVTYRSGGRLRHVLAWGAINARTPTAGQRQVAFKLDYSGGWGCGGRAVWGGFETCGGR